MDGLDFAASVIHSLAWPGAVAVCVVVLKRPLGRALGSGLHRIKVSPGGLELEWEAASAEVTSSASAVAHAKEPGHGSPFAVEMLDLLSKSSPSAVLVAGWDRIGKALADIINGEPSGRPLGLSVEVLSRTALSRGLINEVQAKAVDALARLHRLTLLDPFPIDEARARDWIVLCDLVLYALITSDHYPQAIPRFDFGPT
jgi:hypothetical protein